MSDNAEEGIMRAQAAANKAEGNQIPRQQARSVAYLDERILVFVFAIAFLGLLAIWLTSSSTLLVYGSFVGVLLLIIVGGVWRIKRIHKIRRERELQASNWKSEHPD